MPPDQIQERRLELGAGWGSEEVVGEDLPQGGVSTLAAALFDCRRQVVETQQVETVGLLERPAERRQRLDGGEVEERASRGGDGDVVAEDAGEGAWCGGRGCRGAVALRLW